ncbi:DUF4428 domain-containing protein [Peptostreptococcus equinus]|uniref:SHOCT domain-containing protein n=1 Tax=Peptostreptococcus equinus TaxID=3003601 RepID=A0ABY7JPX7_9FIRM|nr:SHOCT domain-containing protein [Peptostreptococcus sp. CBA3647]WAW15416.1 SHOCT domain-containing protein [Peptostreptococcus sp. CBA3647]
MGLFGKKGKCDVCGKSNKSIKSAPDGNICVDCLNKFSIENIQHRMGIKNPTVEQCRKAIGEITQQTKERNLSTLTPDKICPVCGLNKPSFKVIDGKVCGDCISKATGYNPKAISNARNTMTIQSVKDKISTVEKMDSYDDIFNTSQSYGLLAFDFDNKVFRVSTPVFRGFTKDTIHEYYKFSDILSYKVLEDGDEITSGGLGRATIGGIAFGGVGAVVGAVTSKKKTKKEILSLDILINMKNTNLPTIKVPFLFMKTKARSRIYVEATENVQNCISVFERIKDEIENTPQPTNISSADEIRSFKALLDEGIITQEEFDLKKKELLGI